MATEIRGRLEFLAARIWSAGMVLHCRQILSRVESMAEVTAGGDTPERALELARLEQVRLENEKLKLELAELTQGKPWYHIPNQVVPIVTALVAIGGFSWGVGCSL